MVHRETGRYPPEYMSKIHALSGGMFCHTQLIAST